MYEDYIQNYLNYPSNGYRNTYEQYDYYNYEPRYDESLVENYPYSYASQSQDAFQTQELETYYPEIYKIVYPMVKKVCSQNNRGYGKDEIDRMVEEVYSNIEVNDGARLNITLNNDVRGEKVNNELEENNENRQIRRNNLLNDLIRILILRELIRRRPGCIGPNCRPWQNPRPPRPMPSRPIQSRFNQRYMY